MFEYYPVPKTPCRRGIILAGGTGSRLAPITRAINKHLLPVFDKPMIYYPLTTLMLAGIRDLMIITNEPSIAEINRVCGDGSQWGLRIQYAAQHGANGIAEGLLIGESFIAGEPFALALGDNIFYGHGLPQTVAAAAAHAKRDAGILTYQVANPRDYGVLTVDAQGRPVDLVEKPARPQSHRAVTGLYFYSPEAVEMTRSLRRSPRGELEISDLNRMFLEQGRLHYQEIGRGSVWFDAGTTDNLFAASAYVEIVQRRQSIGIAFPEEVALKMQYVDLDHFCRTVEAFPPCGYRSYLELVMRDAKGDTA